jgi:heme-degrading monooxygenase HmoA
MILTVLKATVPEGNEALLKAAFEAAGKTPRPNGLVRSELLQDTREPKRWRIATLWESRQALVAMRSSGETPAGILMFRSAGAEPELSILDVVDAIT